MKKSVLLVSFLMCSLVVSAAQAIEMPWARVCRAEGGHIWILNLDQQDQPSLCVFGAAAIGSEALFIFKTGNPAPQAFAVYQSGARDCSSQGGNLATYQDTDGNSKTLCTFQDGSLIENETLKRGFGSSANQGLDASILR